MRKICKATVALSCAGFLSALVFFWAGLFLGGSIKAAENEIRILALGDSLTQGYGLPNGTEFPVQLEEALQKQGFNVSVINAGVSGDTSAGGLARLDWSLADMPAAAIIELGGNDGLRGLPPAEMERNLDAILTKFAAAEIPVLLTGMMSPRNMGPSYAAEFDVIFPRLAEKHGVLFYPFFLDGVVLDQNLMQRDGLHANAEGVVEIVRRIMPLVVELIAQADAPA
jgi:acyl-CoA thioesterase-1